MGGFNLAVQVVARPNMQSMFYQASFNQPIGSWDTSAGLTCSPVLPSLRLQRADAGQWLTCGMFEYAVKFNQSMSWDTSAVTDMAAALCGAELRASAVLHAQKHSSRLSSWFAPDSKETPAERGCNPQATNISEWCELQMKQEVWADGLSIQCLAETLGLVIVIFKQ